MDRQMDRSAQMDSRCPFGSGKVNDPGHLANGQSNGQAEMDSQASIWSDSPGLDSGRTTEVRKIAGNSCVVGASYPFAYIATLRTC